jgi:antitoxin MazE
MPASGNVTFEATIQPWGNSLGLRITRPMCDLAHLGRGDKVLVEVDENGLRVRRVARGRRPELPFSEADLIEGMTPYSAHADEAPPLLPSEIGA